MKNSITVLLFMLAGETMAQSITLSEVRPQVGERFLLHRADNSSALVLGNPGTGQVWDFSNATFSGVDDFVNKIIAPAEAPHSANFNNPTYVLQKFPATDSSLSDFAYMKDSAGYLFQLGAQQAILFIDYYDPDRSMKYPIALNDSVVDSYSYSSTAFGTSYYYDGFSSVKFDGTGTLKLPYATFTNVKRVSYNAMQIRQGFNDTSYLEFYYWYAPGKTWPVAVFHKFIFSDNNIYIGFEMIDVPPALSVQRVGSGIDGVYPNPAYSGENVYLQGGAGMSAIQIYDMKGALKYEQQLPDVSSMLPPGCLEPGVYLIRFRGEEQGRTIRLVVQ